MVTVRYFAAVKAAAGTSEDEVEAATLDEAFQQVRRGRDARFAQVLEGCSYLVDGDPVGTRDPHDVALGAGSVVECLPPFAGG